VKIGFGTPPAPGFLLVRVKQSTERIRGKNKFINRR
jgi:hypothetical protein